MLLVKLYRFNANLALGFPLVLIVALNGSAPRLNVLSALLLYRSYLDASLCLRYSCREGICGSCALNIDGANRLGCLCFLELGQNVLVSPLVLSILPITHHLVLKDLVPDLMLFYAQYSAAQPWLLDASNARVLSSVGLRKLLDAHYECILCACCNASCPSY